MAIVTNSTLQGTNLLLHLIKPTVLLTHTNFPQKIITKTIWILSVVSLFTDTASEMLYPVMPVFLKHIGFSIILIGILEGVAEAVAGLSKSYFGKLSDISGKRLPFVQFGYALSAISKPMMAVFIFPAWIFLSRTIDRMGKGIRTGARDAMLSDESTIATKARVFGFHRSMDTLGAVIGPCIALLYLYFNPYDYTTLFLIAFIPGLLAVISTFLIREKKGQKKTTNERTDEQGVIPIATGPINPFSAFWGYWKASPAAYKKLVSGLLAFALVNSSDIFLLLKLKESGLSDTSIIGVYIFYNLVYALVAYPIGIIADKFGLKRILIFGLILFSVVYTGFAFNNDYTIYYLLFVLYAIYAAATESISKAWITNIVDKRDTATAIGTYSGLQSIAALIASSLTGLLWYNFGAMVSFLIIAGVTLGVVFYLSGMSPATNREVKPSP
ncbi:MAG: MFS transporter [Ferruginibacter sp.]|nr:MFS transporter [Ferruginibacter sp.]